MSPWLGLPWVEMSTGLNASPRFRVDIREDPLRDTENP